MAAGVDQVNIYGPAGWHGFRPTDAEFLTYYDDVLDAIKHPVALAPNAVIGYTPRAALIAEVANRHPQVDAINLLELGDTYVINLKEQLKRDVAINVSVPGALQTLSLGATGLLGAQANIIPKTFRRFIDALEQQDAIERDRAYAEILKFIQFFQQWPGGNPRALKMAMHVLALPGAEGGLRKPYLMPAAAEVERFKDGLLRMRLPEIDEQARAAGLSLPA